MLLLINASERVSFLTEPSLMERREEKRREEKKKGKHRREDVDVEEEEEALNQSVISFRESYNSASHLFFSIALELCVNSPNVENGDELANVVAFADEPTRSGRERGGGEVILHL